jgi:ankyrin repeat protein
MNPKLAQIFKGREDLYPRNLESKYPRVFERIMLMWGTSELGPYFNGLFVDDRGGRAGFPAEVMHDILMLSRLHERLQIAQKPARKEDPWSDSAVRGALANEQIEFSPAGLFRAIHLGNENAVRLFLGAGIDPGLVNPSGWTPLIASASVGNLSAAAALIDAGVNVDTRDPQGYTPLHWAAFRGFPKVAELLADKGADVNAKSSLGLTPLLQAALGGHAAVVGVLLAKGAQVNEADNDGLTPLHNAVTDGHLAVIKMLVAAGADANAKSAKGITPAMIAGRKNDPAIIAAMAG